MYPFSSLPGNLAAFCEVLRRGHGFQIGPAELADAARALEIVDLGDSSRVRAALRLVLSGRLEDVAVFDRAFEDFFFPARAGVRQEGLPPIDTPVRPAEPTLAPLPERPAAAGTEGEPGPGGDDAVSDAAPVETDEGDAGDARIRRARASTSPAAGAAPVAERPDDPWRDAARAFVRRVRLDRSRRWRPAGRGLRFDLRRTLRASLHTGGEALTPRWLARPRRTARFVLLIDGSRSMQACGDAPLRLASALVAASARVEAFTFSTSLRRITADVRAAAWAGARPLDGLEDAWGGGTRMGACLRDMLRTAGDRVLARDTCVIIASDGLDAGDPMVLGDAMREIARRSAGIVWLNPLAGTHGYEPTAAGMRAALPHVATFAALRDATDLLRLGRQVQLRRR